MSDRWNQIDAFVDSILNVSPDVLMAHGVHLLAVRRMDANGLAVPELLRDAERANTFRYLAGRSLLERMRSVLDGPMVLVKGPEVAAHYPSPTLRAYGDLDVLVPDSVGAKAILLANGFVEVDDYEFPHAQRPLRYPGLPLVVELHHQLPWLRWMTPPPPEHFIHNAVPSTTNLEGIGSLHVIDQVLLIAAHSWKHAPLRRLSDFMDIAFLAAGQDETALCCRAEAWGLTNVWATMYRTTERLLDGKNENSIALRMMARHLDPPRHRTVVENHFARWMGALWAPSMRSKGFSFLETLIEDISPLPGEPWRDKIVRTGWAVRGATHPALIRQRHSGGNRR